ncbi:hypothetical protein CYME_CME185C [Cyanidioschyzon merolae strain 10D]|jgi:hypothetical protein|uniref:Uncharacterized protein n=1 Tax=Cyanidioschyzon merolae (strain NIES-3377 / 10D) TaxID=280699 RepID=M1V718_CYAM1|nr:hypothetical protein CYME_CME185C [Cyanidioschyzon merolae strain 10D]BAM79389.1 hypothetical protein CYME_CME185C [Cyanidioschyzon merolae strain 10D]|eukprot:XP_005535675.1 hypothetical protein CYME_CME185C [Cyanidioschyzon merolae strain 10D]
MHSENKRTLFIGQGVLDRHRYVRTRHTGAVGETAPASAHGWNVYARKGGGGGGKRGSNRAAGRRLTQNVRPGLGTPLPFVAPPDGDIRRSTAEQRNAESDRSASTFLKNLLFRRAGTSAEGSSSRDASGSSASYTPETIDVLKRGAWIGIFSLIGLEFFIHVLYKKDWLSILSKHP